MRLFLEKGMRCGVSYISRRYSKSDQNKKIMYWDGNNLYGWAMIQDLPYSGFKWLNNKEINDFDFNISEKSPIGYILEVDLEYCKELHDSLCDYPLCSEIIEISSDMLSNYCKDIADRYEIKIGGVKKLIPNLDDKVKYVVHYKNIKYYLSLRMKLVKIHRILRLKQSDWLAKYINFNTKKRQESTDEFNKNVYKLLNNCIYGKSIENIRKRISDQKTYQKCVNKPNFISQKIFDKSFVTVHCSKTVETLNKPIYI